MLTIERRHKASEDLLILPANIREIHTQFIYEV